MTVSGLTIDRIKQIAKHKPHDFNESAWEAKELAERLLTAMQREAQMRDALEDIGNTAQCASHHQPEQFCEWAAHRVGEALSNDYRDTEK